MPTKTNLGGVFMTDMDNRMSTGANISTEFVCGLIFDVNGIGTIDTLLTGDAAKNFANGNVVELNGTSDIKDVGIDENQMCGLPYHHLKNFFTLAGEGQRLFVSFMDSNSDQDFSAIEKMQLASGGIIYQIGVWTSQAIAKSTSGEDGSYTVEGDSLLSKLQSQADLLGGKIGVTNFDGNQPLNVLLNAPIIDSAIVDYSKLPDLTTLNLPKVSVFLGQPATDAVHKIQLDLIKKSGETIKYVQVGNLGAVLACLAVAPVDVKIAYVANFNLSMVMTSCELGFGNLTLNTKKDAFDESVVSFNNIKTISYTKRNTKLHQKGYNFLRDYEGLENGVFISDDMTLSTGDYRSLTRCRTMHKARRSVRLALLPMVNQAFEVDTSTGQLTDADVTVIRNAVYNALDKNMVQPGTQTTQISGREVTIDKSQNILENDQLLIDFAIVPKGYASAIYVTEGFASSFSS